MLHATWYGTTYIFRCSLRLQGFRYLIFCRLLGGMTYVVNTVSSCSLYGDLVVPVTLGVPLFSRLTSDNLPRPSLTPSKLLSGVSQITLRPFLIRFPCTDRSCRKIFRVCGCLSRSICRTGVGFVDFSLHSCLMCESRRLLSQDSCQHRSSC